MLLASCPIDADTVSPNELGTLYASTLFLKKIKSPDPVVVASLIFQLVEVAPMFNSPM